MLGRRHHLDIVAGLTQVTPDQFRRSRRRSGSLESRSSPSDFAERKPAMKDTQKSAKSTAIDKTSEGWTDEERVAIKERAQELKAAGRRGASAGKADGES